MNKKNFIKPKIINNTSNENSNDNTKISEIHNHLNSVEKFTWLNILITIFETIFFVIIVLKYCRCVM
jgi:hypothetical protein